MKSRIYQPPSRQFLILLVLACSITLTFAQSIRAANWLSSRADVLATASLSILFGILLARSRFRGITALAYHAVLSVLYAADSYGHFFPTSALQRTGPGENALWIMHLRLRVTVETMSGWLQKLLAKQGLGDPSWVLFCITLVTWNLLAWMVWWVFRKKRAMVGIVPLGTVFALNIHLSDQPTHSLLLFILLSVLSIVGCEYWRNHLDWGKRRVDHPDMVFEWVTYSILLSFVLTFLAFSFPLFASAQGLHSISDFLHRIRLEPRSSAAQDSRSGAASVRPSRPNARTPDVSIIGTPIDQSTETIMYVRLSDPPPTPNERSETPSPTSQHYWRQSVFGVYTGRGWEPIPKPPSGEVTSPPDSSPVGRYALDQSFQILAAYDEMLFAVNQPFVGGENVQVVPIGKKDAILIGKTGSYTVTSWATDLSIEELITADSIYPQEVLAVYLQLPQTLPARVRDLAARITAGAQSAYDKATRIEQYLRGQYPYTLDVPPVPEGADAVDYFLFDAPGGFCTYYASAMAVMLRTQGIPARVVSGYAMGTYDETDAAYRVLGRDSHAWVEVYFPDYGWVEFEPTAARSTFPRSSESIEPLTTHPETDPAQLVIISRRTLRIVVVLLILVSAGWAVFLSLKRIDFTPKTPRQEIQNLYRDIRRALRKVGYAAQPSTTPNEFLGWISRSMTEAPGVLAALTHATGLFLKARYSDLDIETDQPRAARALWRSALPQYASMRLQNSILKPCATLFHRIKRSNIKAQHP